MRRKNKWKQLFALSMSVILAGNMSEASAAMIVDEPETYQVVNVVGEARDCREAVGCFISSVFT
ncbi:MAG: hypothetical protein ACLT46_09945 [Hungatella sp.]